MNTRRALFSLLSLVVVAIASRANAEEAIPLWPNGAPGSEDRASEPEHVDRAQGRMNVTNIHNPSITPYLPKPEAATGAAIIIAPGGGHRMLCLGHEGPALARWFAEHGIAAFVLKYRLAREEGSNYTVDEHAMADTRRSIRLVRSRAAEWKIDPDRIGILGFSAGGELAAQVGMQPEQPMSSPDQVDQQSSQPNFQILVYPGSSSRFTVHAGMPPAFIVLGENDRPDISEGMAKLYLKYKEAQVPCELHIYSGVGHGFGFRGEEPTAVGRWPMRVREWLLAQKMVKQ
jgi:endo-1,4-beta-xylanase